MPGARILRQPAENAALRARHSTLRARARGDLRQQRLPQQLAGRPERRCAHRAARGRIAIGEHDLAGAVDDEHAFAQRLQHRARSFVGPTLRHRLGDGVATAFGASGAHRHQHAFAAFRTHRSAFDEHFRSAAATTDSAPHVIAPHSDASTNSSTAVPLIRRNPPARDGPSRGARSRWLGVFGSPRITGPPIVPARHTLDPVALQTDGHRGR